MSKRRRAAGVFDILDPAKHTAARFRQRLAVLARNARADAIEVLLDQLPVAEEQPRALHRRRVAPGGKRRRGGFDRFVHRLGAAHRHFRDRLAARGIENRRGAVAVSGAPFAADEGGAGRSSRTQSASDCFTNSSPLHSPSARDHLLGRGSSAAALSLRLCAPPASAPGRRGW